MPALLRLPAVMALTGKARATVYRDVQRGDFPKPIKIGPGAVAWLDCEVADWIAAKVRESRPETTPAA